MELRIKWGFWPSLFGCGELFIRCNSKAHVNWDKAPVYTWGEIQKEQIKRPVKFLVDPEIFKL